VLRGRSGRGWLCFLTLLFLRRPLFPEPTEHGMKVLLLHIAFRRNIQLLHMSAKAAVERLQADVEFEIRSTLSAREHAATTIIHQLASGDIERAAVGCFRERVVFVHGG
jgi:hypothetical protein